VGQIEALPQRGVNRIRLAQLSVHDGFLSCDALSVAAFNSDFLE